ncbi:UNVERIFIED_CONTAM: Structural maintenance of chromosomes protein 6 [Siphonaria sp. JEL0065]|nr:Structural maintenance of chromosomes protein 6 [Siphonaria sp. JEL0065]
MLGERKTQLPTPTALAKAVNPAQMEVDEEEVKENPPRMPAKRPHAVIPSDDEDDADHEEGQKHQEHLDDSEDDDLVQTSSSLSQPKHRNKKPRKSAKTAKKKLSNAQVLALPALTGSIEKVVLNQFMCHQLLEVDFCPKINFVIGHNGSGKSAILTGVMVCLGGKAKVTDRAQSLKSLVMEGKKHMHVLGDLQTSLSLRSIQLTWNLENSAASVTVSINNKGPEAYKPEVYGQTIMVERIITKDGSGSYKIKDADGTTQAHRKEDLTAILDHMSIAIDNPLSILTQDTSRQFLANSTSKDKYQFFSRGTLLSQLSEDHTFVNDCIKNASDSFDRRAALLPDIKKDFHDAKAKYDEVKKFEGLENEINNLKEQYTWAVVEEKEGIIIREKRGLSHIEKKLEERNAQLLENEGRLEMQQDRKKNQETILEELKGSGDPCFRRFQEAKDAMKVLNDQKQGYELQESQAQGLLRSAVHARNAMQQRIDIEARKLGGFDREMRERKLAEIDRCKREKEDAGKRTIAITEELDALESGRSAADNKLSQLRGQIQRIRGNIDEEGRSIAQLRRNYDPVSAYGRDMQNILNEIADVERRKGWVGSTPVGPLGLHINLLKPDFKKVIEGVLGPLLKSFVVDTVEDREKLKAIFQKYRCPSNILKQDGKKINIASGEPHSEILTFFRAMDIRHEVVMRQLVIHRNIEKLGLVYTKHEGDLLATSGEGRRMPRNLNTVYTVDNVQIGGRGGGLQTRAGEQRSNGMPLLGVDVEIEINDRNKNVERMQQELRVLNRDQLQFEQELKGLDQDIRKLKNDRQTAVGMTRQMDNAIKRLQDDLIEEEPAQISLFEEKKKEAEDEMEGYEMQLAGLGESKRKVVADIRQKQEELNDLKRELDQIQHNFDLEKRNLREIMEEIQKIERYRYDITLKQRELVAKADAAKETIAGLEEEVEELKGKALEITDGKRVDTGGQTPERLGHTLRIKEAALRENLKHTGSKEEVTAKLHETRQIYDDAKIELNAAHELIEHLKLAVDARMDDWHRLRAKISKRARNTFTIMMDKRGFQAKLLLDHHKQTLDLKVDVHNLGATVSQAKKDKDPKTLSGGEKSFSTDAVNRKISMQNMIHYARSSDPPCQYIFITPQDMSHVPDMNGKDVRVHKLRDPERGQTRLNFAPAE